MPRTVHFEVAPGRVIDLLELDDSPEVVTTYQINPTDRGPFAAAVIGSAHPEEAKYRRAGLDTPNLRAVDVVFVEVDGGLNAIVTYQPDRSNSLFGNPGSGAPLPPSPPAQEKKT